MKIDWDRYLEAWDGPGARPLRRKLRGITAVNEEIQEWISTTGADIPGELLKMLSDLDWAVRE